MCICITEITLLCTWNIVKVNVKVSQSCPTLCDPQSMEFSWARILEWVAVRIFPTQGRNIASQLHFNKVNILFKKYTWLKSQKNKIKIKSIHEKSQNRLVEILVVIVLGRDCHGRGLMRLNRLVGVPFILITVWHIGFHFCQS